MKWTRLGDIADFVNGRAFKPEEWENTGLPIIRIQNLNDHTKAFNYTSKVYPDKYLVNTNDILFSWSGTPGSSFGCFHWRRQQGWLNQHIFNVHFYDASTIDGGFFIRAVNSQLNKIIDQAHGGVGLKHITKKKLLEIEIPLPPLAEQKRIAAILDAADALRQQRRKSIDLLDQLIQSTFLHLFGDPVTNPKGWEVKLSKDLFSVPPRIGTTTPAKGSGYIVVRVGELGNTKINLPKCGRVELSEKDYAKFVIEPGDTVLARAIGSKNQLGKSSYYDGHTEPVVIDSHVMRLRPDQSICDPRWLYCLLSSDRGKVILQRAGGATAVQFNINAKQASSLKIPLPPLDLQQEFANTVEKIEAQKSRYRTQLAELDTLFLSLQSRAFKGELSGAPTLSLPSSARKPFENSDDYIVALISSYLQDDISERSIEQLVSALRQLESKEVLVDFYMETSGENAQLWLNSHCDKLELERLKEVLERLIDHEWISITADGLINKLPEFQEPENAEWAKFDMNLTLRSLPDQSKISRVPNDELTNIYSIYQSA